MALTPVRAVRLASLPAALRISLGARWTLLWCRFPPLMRRGVSLLPTLMLPPSLPHLPPPRAVLVFVGVPPPLFSFDKPVYG